MTPTDAAYFDDWYAAMSVSTRRDAIVRDTLGLPPELESSSLLPWDGIADVVKALAVANDDVLVDLACGRGGYGLEFARRTGASLLGVDFSATAVEHARRRAADDPDVVAEFRVGDLTATDLPDASAAAVVCIDAMQFAEPYSAGLAECRRVLVPGGRLVLTGWEPLDPGDDVLPQRLRHDIGKAMTDAGFGDVVVRSMPQWQLAERALWNAAVATDPGEDPALESLRDEGTRTLPLIDKMRRVLAVARVPATDSYDRAHG